MFECTNMPKNAKLFCRGRSMDWISRRSFLGRAGTLAAATTLFGGTPAGEATSPGRSANAMEHPNNILLSGPDWKLGSYLMDAGEKQGAFRQDLDESDFKTVTVPGEVQLQVGLEGMDRYYQSRGLTLINQKEWWYRKKFRVPKAAEGKLNRLMFDGVDYFATVWLNGEKLGTHEGCFVPFSFDVGPKLKYDDENLLAVKVTCPWLPEGRGFLEYMKGEWAEVVPGWVVRFPFPPFVLGPTWDGLPAGGNALFPMGLWRDVRLITSGWIVIEDLFVQTQALNPDGSATLQIHGTINNHGRQDISGTLSLAIAPDNFAGEKVSLPAQEIAVRPGKNTFSREVVLQDARLWWTWDMGKQNLYKAYATLGYGGEEEARDTVFGVRTIARHPNMTYWLNGKRLFLKGAWYPMADYYGSKPTRETYEQDLRMFRAANLNHLVAFTVVEKNDFYDLCDRLGILEMFEFPFTQFGPMEVLSPSNPRRDIYIKESLSQVRQILIQLRNHPSIILWAPFAEAHEKSGGWGAGGEDFGKYGYAAFAEKIRKLVEELSPGSIFHPSFCDAGEQHFWMGNAGMGTSTNYSQHFYANTGFVSEYGSIALPVFETLQKMLTPEEIWSEKNQVSSGWFDLPIDISAYAYQTSFDYEGLSGVLDRINQFVDRHPRSPRELIDDSQLYQAFIFKYATESYRRKKYNSIAGTRIWAYGEVCPGIRFNFLDYYRNPKMGYYYLKSAQERFALNFAYEEALESQASGKTLQIPVWLVNDHRHPLEVDLHCEVRDMQGRTLWSQDLAGSLEEDSAREMGILKWRVPDEPGVYVLRGEAKERGGGLRTSNSAFIKVVPRLFSRPVNVLIIGQRKYSLPIACMLRSMGTHVDVIDEESIHRLAELQDADEIQEKYHVVWLAVFDSFWKLLDDKVAVGLRHAVSNGVGFIHSGGPGSYHGGSIRAACLDFTPLAEVLPVKLKNRNDLVYGQASVAPADFHPTFSPLKEIEVTPRSAEQWDAGSMQRLRDYGVDACNAVELKPDSQEILKVASKPLLVEGRYGKGRTVAFTGFTPPYEEQRAYWDEKIVFPYLVDQEFYRNPGTKAYFDVFMRMMALATGETPATPYKEMLAAREKPLFEMLKDLPPVEVRIPASLSARVSNQKAQVKLRVTNGDRYAHLVRVRAEWNGEPPRVPYLLLYSDNYFDLLPGESREIVVEAFFSQPISGTVSGALLVEGCNVPSRQSVVELMAA